MTQQIAKLLTDSAAAKTRMAQDNALLSKIAQAADRMIAAIKDGGTIYSCGNGGSACDSIHLTEELIARFKLDRPGIKAMHMQDAGVLTCWSNDYAYDTIFERYVKTFCGSKDVLVALSTSGNSPNVLKAFAAARETGTFSIGLGGRDGGKLKESCDLAIVVPVNETERIQECHITIIHILCELIETTLSAVR